MEYWNIEPVEFKGITVPSGTACEWNTKCQCYFVKPKFFAKNSMARHDAVHYGCRVETNNIKHIDDEQD